MTRGSPPSTSTLSGRLNGSRRCSSARQWRWKEAGSLRLDVCFSGALGWTLLACYRRDRWKYCSMFIAERSVADGGIGTEVPEIATFGSGHRLSKLDHKALPADEGGSVKSISLRFHPSPANSESCLRTQFAGNYPSWAHNGIVRQKNSEGMPRF